MSRRIRTGDAALAELAEAVRFYEQQRSGLGRELLDEVAHTLELIEAHPEIGGALRRDGKTRGLLMTQFPFRVIYHLTDAAIEIVALAHTSRRPGYWRGR